MSSLKLDYYLHLKILRKNLHLYVTNKISLNSNKYRASNPKTGKELIPKKEQRRKRENVIT